MLIPVGGHGHRLAAATNQNAALLGMGFQFPRQLLGKIERIATLVRIGAEILWRKTFFLKPRQQPGLERKPAMIGGNKNNIRHSGFDP